MTPRMTRLKFLELAMEGAASRLVGAQGLNETQYAALHADANYIDARLKDERKRLALKERNKGALAQALDKAKLTPRAVHTGAIQA